MKQALLHSYLYELHKTADSDPLSTACGMSFSGQLYPVNFLHVQDEKIFQTNMLSAQFCQSWPVNLDVADGCIITVFATQRKTHSA